MGFSIPDILTFTRLAWLLALALVGCASDEPAPPVTPPPVTPPSDAGGADASGDADAFCASCGGCEEMQTVTTARHVVGPVDYPDPPPVGGEHSQCWGAWGEQATELKPERWVHNLEHGGVVLLFNCPDGCADEVERMRGFVATHPRTILTPYHRLPERFAAVAWQYRLVSDCLDLTAFERFYTLHFDHGPESIDAAPPSQCLSRPEL
ncbi:MAG: DUF3105 domain-containing protein [Polyangiales bacterium]